MIRFARGVLLLVVLGLCLALALAWLRPVPPRGPLPQLTGQVDRIVVEKSARRLTLWQEGRAIRSYQVALGFDPVGQKQRQGDGRTPEGLFHIDRRNENSRFHLSLGLDYPRPEDRARAAAAGVDPGGDIMIHAQPNSVPDGFKAVGDWTAGCIALTNAEMREVWAMAPIGTPVEVRP